jgi:hypothetical protein
MADEKKNQELSEEELQQAAGGKAFARRQGDLAGGGTVVPDADGADSGGDDPSGPSIGGVTPMDDPAFQ